MSIKKPWYIDYPRWNMYLDVLSKYPNYFDFEDKIPSHLIVNLDKICLWETCEWFRFNDKYSRFPTIAEIKKARERRNYTCEQLLLIDNYGEHF